MAEQPTKRRGPLLWLAARTWRFWGGMVLLPVMYGGSFGPVCWLYMRGYLSYVPVVEVYRPMLLMADDRFSTTVGKLQMRYVEIWVGVDSPALARLRIFAELTEGN